MLTINKIQESSSSSSNMDKEDEKCQYFLQAILLFFPPIFPMFFFRGNHSSGHLLQTRSESGSNALMALVDHNRYHIRLLISDRRHSWQGAWRRSRCRHDQVKNEEVLWDLTRNEDDWGPGGSHPACHSWFEYSLDQRSHGWDRQVLHAGAQYDHQSWGHVRDLH